MGAVGEFAVFNDILEAAFTDLTALEDRLGSFVEGNNFFYLQQV